MMTLSIFTPECGDTEFKTKSTRVRFVRYVGKPLTKERQPQEGCCDASMWGLGCGCFGYFA